MAVFLDGGVDVFNALSFAQPSQKDIAFFNNNIQTLTQTIGQSGQQFFSGLQDRLQVLDFDHIREYAQAAARRIANYWQTDTIRPLESLVDLQFPPNQMIRWQMANPNVRELYHQDLCAGYGDKYVDLDPNVSGEYHPDYRVVMHGIEQTDDDGNLFWESFDETFDNPELSVNQLDHLDRVHVLMSWQQTDYYLSQQKEDPTSQYSGML